MKVLYFTAAWCAPCKALKPIAQEASLETGVPIQFIDIEQNRDQVSTYGISSVPTLIGVNQGEVKFRHTGMTNKQNLKNLFNTI
jgi:thioredoxin 1